MLSAALNYALFDRCQNDFFVDPVEIEYARANRETIIRELMQELAEPSTFEPRTAFAFFPPKNDLCDRRMIYLPIKDLTIRYAMAIVLSEQIDGEIHPQCFANRRATGEDASRRFTADFATGGWMEFCAWQAECADRNSVLLRTDISSFYDSVSHEYLIDAICRHLVLPKECPFADLLRRILRVPVIYYSTSTGQIEGPALTHQGLPLGDGVEGYLANLYLKDVDDAMMMANACYGRYVDDMRLFGNSRAQVIRQLRILQEQLLHKGLNLNASKTEIAEDKGAVADLMSRLSAAGGYEQEDEEPEERPVVQQIDRPFEEFDREFAESDGIKSGSDAKDFCKYLSKRGPNGLPVVGMHGRRRWHVQHLAAALTRWRGAAKHAAWLLVQAATYRGVPGDVQREARRVMMGLLGDGETSAYVRYRVLHHLLKVRRSRRGGAGRLLQVLTNDERGQIAGLMATYLAAPAFELNLIALHYLRLDGCPEHELRRLVAEHCRRGCEPVRNALALAAELPPAELPAMIAVDEPDESPAQY